MRPLMMDWSSVNYLWIIVMFFLWTVWTLILMAMNFSKSIGDALLQICSDEETISSTSGMAWG